LAPCARLNWQFSVSFQAPRSRTRQKWPLTRLDGHFCRVRLRGQCGRAITTVCISHSDSCKNGAC